MAGPGNNEPTAVDDAGNEFVVRNGNWVPKEQLAPENQNLEEMKGLAKAGGVGLIKGATDVAGLPGDVQGLVNAGLNRFMPSSPAAEQPPPRAPTQFENTLNALRGGAELPTSQGIQKSIQGVTGPFYQPQTGAEKVMQSAGETVPFGMLGRGPMLTNMGRAALSGGASEAAGQATEGTGFETPARIGAGLGTYGLLTMSPSQAIHAAPDRAGWIRTMQQGGARPSASDISGGRLAATLEGGPLPKQVGEVNRGIVNLSGTPRAGGTATLADDLAAQRAALKTQGDQLAASTNIPPAQIPQLRQQLDTIVKQHERDFAGSQNERPEVRQGLDSFDNDITNNVLQGRPGLNGAQYQRYHEMWSGSPIPEVRQMSHLLDSAMDTAHPNAWEGWRTAYADNKALLSQDVQHGAGTLSPLDPASVGNALYKQTPMKNFADASTAIMKNRPQPYAPNLTELLGASGASGILGAVGGHALNVGTDPGIEGFLVGGAVPGTLSLLGRAAHPFFQGRAGQNMLRTMDPRMVAALLAQQGITPKAQPVQQQEGTAQ